MIAAGVVQWKGLEAPGLRGGDLAALLAGDAGYVRIPGFMSRGDCEEAASRFSRARHEAREYGEVYWEQVGGTWQADPEGVYFKQSRHYNEQVRRLYEGLENPLDKLRRALAEATGWACLELLENGVPYCEHIVGATPPDRAVPAHPDLSKAQRIEAARLGMQIERFPRQFSANVYLTAADQGGELCVHRRRFKFEEERLEPCPIVFREFGRAIILPEPGDLVVFDSECYHEVFRTRGSRDRIASHSFVSLDPERRLFALWA